MATRGRSWAIAAIATAAGMVLFTYDDFLDHNDLAGSTLHQIAAVIEFMIIGPGMGVLAFIFCEYIRLNAEHMHVERQRAHEARLLFLGRIAASIAHEVRNPLHNLRLLLEDPQQIHHDATLAARVAANLDRINRAVEAVYQLARPGTADEDDEAGCDLVSLLHEAVAGTTVTNRITPTISCQTTKALTTAPAIVVRMVLDNLLRNAYAAAEDKLALSLRLVGGNWCLCVRNPGTLPPELLDIEQKKSPNTNDNPEPASNSAAGLGLGLFISRHLLTRVGGKLELRQVSEQVEATVTLPSWQP